MPKVGDKHFSYDAAGIAAAKSESARTGVPMSGTQKYQVGGLVNIPRGDLTRGAGAERKKSRCRTIRCK